jgi:hypothetical protein
MFDKKQGIADLRYELPSKSGVGAIHELPLPQISEIAYKKSSLNSATPKAA